MKRLIFLSAIMVAFNLNLKSQTVYITESGKKYHAKNCHLAKTGKKGISLAEAAKLGYVPCKICKADEVKPGTVKSKSKVKNLKK